MEVNLAGKSRREMERIEGDTGSEMGIGSNQRGEMGNSDLRGVWSEDGGRCDDELHVCVGFQLVKNKKKIKLLMMSKTLRFGCNKGREKYRYLSPNSILARA